MDKIALRYIPPQTAKTKITRATVEVGDFNILSNKWLFFENLDLENRKGIPGGIEFSTNLSYNFSFININSDHDAMFIEIKKRIKSEKMIDYSKLSVSMTD